jgi:hypothetical protein
LKKKKRNFRCGHSAQIYGPKMSFKFVDTGVVEVSAEDKVWVAPQFERGGIPDTPPPAIFCN